MTAADTVYVEHYRAGGLTGSPASPGQVDAAERALGIPFPAAYRAFLLILGDDGGPDYVGTDLTIHHLPRLRPGAEGLLREAGAPPLPERAVVFSMHQGYSFLYFVADADTEDPPVLLYVEGDPEPTTVAPSFSDWLSL